MTDKPKIGDGDVPITIAGKAYKLVPTYEAAMNLCKTGDGLAALITQCAALDGNAIKRVVAAGLGKEADDLGQLLWAEGWRVVSGPAIEFLVILSNGGRPVPKKEKPGPLGETES